MSRIIQKLIIGNTRCGPKETCKVTVKLMRFNSDDGRKSGKKKSKRPVYTPENPVSNNYSPENPVSNNYSPENPVSTENKREHHYPTANPEYKLDDSEVSFEVVKCTTSNPECNLENPESTLPSIVYSKANPASIDQPPTTCCMSGCNNCVYIVWAEELSKQMATADPKVAKKILEQVQDPGMKSFLQMELRNLGILK